MNAQHVGGWRWPRGLGFSSGPPDDGVGQDLGLTKLEQLLGACGRIATQQRWGCGGAVGREAAARASARAAAQDTRLFECRGRSVGTQHAELAEQFRMPREHHAPGLLTMSRAILERATAQRSFW